MIESHQITLTLNWLKTKLIKQDHGILLEDYCAACSFEAIQHFIASIDHPLKTPVIYYEAFPEENASQFLSTLSEELTSKLGFAELNSNQSLGEIIQASGLKMIIIDQSYLHPLDTIETIINFFTSCQVGVILVGSREKLKIAQILSHPLVAQWDKFAVCDRYRAISY